MAEEEGAVMENVQEQGEEELEEERRSWLEDVIDEEGNVDMKKKNWNNHRWEDNWENRYVDLSSLPARCTQQRRVGCCHFGYYFNQNEGRCDSLYTDSEFNLGDNDNFFSTKADCQSVCRTSRVPSPFGGDE